MPAIEDVLAGLARSCGRLLPAVVTVGLVVSLVYRAEARGPYYPGWDILGSAQGLQALSTSPPGEAVARLLRGAAEFRYWNTTDSLVYTLVPGALGRLWPYEFWAHWLTLALVVLTFFLILRFAGLAAQEAWLLGLAWLASSSLLSFSVAGYPYATGFLPHALALFIVASPWLRARPLHSLVASLATTELSWHVYEAGKTLVVVFVLAALIERAAPLATRGGWLAVSAVQVGRVLFRRGFNVDYVIAGAGTGSGALAAAAGRVVEALAGGVDLPLVVPLGLLALVFVRRHRWLLIGGVASQLATVLLAAAVEPAAIRPRRLLTTTFYCLTALAVFFAESSVADRKRLRLALVVALGCGGLWQVLDLRVFFSVPPAGRTQPLPYTFSPDDYFVAAGATDLAREVRAEVERGRIAVLLYNLNSETIADPEALLERVYVTTGQARFERRVLAFGHRRCRYDCLPILPLEAVEQDMRGLAALPGTPVAFYKKALEPRRHVEESKLVLAALVRHFTVVPAAETARGFGRLELLPRTGASAAVAIEAPTEPLPLDLAWLADPREPGSVRRSPNGEHAFGYEWSATVVAAEDVAADLLLGCDGRLRVSVDGQRVAGRAVSGFTLWRERVLIPRGRHAVDLEYETRSGSGRLLFQVEQPLLR